MLFQSSHRFRSCLAVAAIGMLAGCTILDRLSRDPEPFPEDASTDANIEAEAKDVSRDAPLAEDAADSAISDARESDATRDAGTEADGPDAARDASADAEDGG